MRVGYRFCAFRRRKVRRRCIFQVETARLGALLGNMFFKKQKARFREPKAVTREVPYKES